MIGIHQLYPTLHGNGRDFSDCVVYVTVEPCIMCATALSAVGIGRVFYGCHNSRFGGNGSILTLNVFDPDVDMTAESKCKDDAEETALTSVSQGLPPGASPYSSEGGHHAQEAIALLRTFCESGNQRLPPRQIS